MTSTFVSNIVPISVIVLFVNVVWVIAAWGDSDKVKLTDVKAITLYHNRMTTGRRSSPIPQLQCVGGTASCSAFVPNVVQCYNRGSNGYDVQWECKTDMDNLYRFGKIEVVCEGYDYPNDPYVLKGSCGLEYTIDYTKEGYQKKGSSYFKRNGENFYKAHHSSSMGAIFLLIAVGIIVYALYKTCLQTHQYSNTSYDYPSGSDHHSGFFGNMFGSNRRPSAPPPPGFRPGFTGDAGCAGTTGSSFGTGTQSGFWTGAMTGGLLGYMFGRSNQGTSDWTRHSSRGYRDRSCDSGWGSSSFDSSSSGTRTASGFGETKRR